MTCENISCKREAGYVHFLCYHPLRWHYFCGKCVFLSFGQTPHLIKLPEDWFNLKPPPPPREPSDGDVLMQNLKFFHDMKNGTLCSP